MKKKLSKAVKIWLWVSAPLLSIVLTASILLVNVPFFKGTIDSVFGSGSQTLKGDASKYIYYEKDYENKQKTLEAANKLNEKICEEGFTLLKNEDKALPLKKGAKVSVFGNNSVNPVYGGSGSNAGGSHGGEVATLYSSLSAAGFTVNPVMKAFYDNSSVTRPAAPGMGSILTGFPIAEVPLSSYTSTVKNSYKEYNDAAIVFLSRMGGEGFDLPRTMFYDGSKYTSWSGSTVIPGAKGKDSHYLELDLNETDMIREACENFDKVIVVLNSSSAMELGFLTDGSFPDTLKAAVWVGSPGTSGLNALGRILNGEVNPSGRTVDTYARDFTLDPTWNNFGNNLKQDGNRYIRDGKAINAYFVNYVEGIYTGYRYYETRGAEEAAAGNNEWYDKNVVFPFGYGLSYTDFEWTVKPLKTETTFTGDDELKFEVTVKNTGSVKGKDVLELYYTSPYTKGGIEKSHVVLGDFVKTKLLEPGESQTYALSVSARDMASYDYSDKNNNGFKGYELESGSYSVKIAKNAHDTGTAFTYTLESGVKYKTDEVTGTTVKNLFDDVSGRITKYFSRADFEGTFPKKLTDEDMVVTKALTDTFNYKLNDTSADPWYTTEKPVQQAKSLAENQTKTKLYELIGKDFDDPKWNELLDQLTVDEMVRLVSRGNYHTEQLENILKPRTIDADGPMGFSVFMGDPSVYDTCFYASECVLGATFNVEIAKETGVMIGNESLVGYENGDGRTYSGWYAPAMNIHRSQFGGRNFEYYSEDPVLSGKMATGVVKGAAEKGVYAYCKHFALNDQETNRDTTGLVTWADEQTMREVYFKPFEEVVKTGKTTAMMSAFNRIGGTWAGGSYPLLTSLLRKEWGFKGVVITDYNLTPYMNVDQMIRAGGDLNLSAGKDFKDVDSAVALTSLRRASKNVLYAVANSNAMNGLGEGVRISYNKAVWEIILIACDCVLFLALAAWGLVAFRVFSKGKKTA